MAKRKKIIPALFGKTLSTLIGWITENKYEEEALNIMAEMAERKGLLKMLTSKDQTEKETADKVMGFVSSAVDFGLMVGYRFGQWYPLDHPGITEDLNYLSARIPTLDKGGEGENVFFRRNVFFKKMADMSEDKTIGMTEHEIEKAASTIVLCWPKNQEAIKDLTEKFKKGISAEPLVS